MQWFHGTDGCEQDRRRVGRVFRVLENGNVVVCYWRKQSEEEGENDSFFSRSNQLPLILVATSMIFELPRPEISLAFVFHVENIINFKVRLVVGMEDVFCFRHEERGSEMIFLPPTNDKQSILSASYIVFDSITRVSSEMQKILCNMRQHQKNTANASLHILPVFWHYVTEKLKLPVIPRTIVRARSVPGGRDLSTIRVKSRMECFVIRFNNFTTLSSFISIFGVAAVVGARKRPPKVSQKLSKVVGSYATHRGGVQKLDLINLVDVEENSEIPPPKFSMDDDGRQGVDLVFIPDLHNLTIRIRYQRFVNQIQYAMRCLALPKCRQLLSS